MSERGGRGKEVQHRLKVPFTTLKSVLLICFRFILSSFVGSTSTTSPHSLLDSYTWITYTPPFFSLHSLRRHTGRFERPPPSFKRLASHFKSASGYFLPSWGGVRSYRRRHTSHPPSSFSVLHPKFSNEVPSRPTRVALCLALPSTLPTQTKEAEQREEKPDACR